MTVYYDANDLTHDGLDVYIMAPEGDVIARRKIITRKERTTVIWGVKVTERLPGRPLRHHYVDLPRWVQVTRWRPIDPDRFPGPLPSPARVEGRVGWQSRPEPMIPIEDQDELEWPYPYEAAPNISAREAEVRVLRGLRTERSRHAVKEGRLQGYLDSALALIYRQMGELKYDYIDPSYV